ncbi:MAG: hypothetical protein GF344_16695 [Chitinivibrionales bacterium]|nr:hypothetical protein [Chitinivibrionales bacterium]MBD3358327.1 hypothetical protein [Chitinivibrionales bacterium]
MATREGAGQGLLANPTVRILFIFVAGMFAFALAFSVLEGISFFDAIYWAITTCSTVGYGDLSPSNPLSKVLTMFVMVSGVALLGYLLSTVSEKIVSLNMSRMMGLSRVKLSDHVIIAGWNTVARIALDELLETDKDIVVVDTEQQPEVADGKRVHFVLGDYQDEDTLQKAGITAADAIILAMESDSEVVLGISAIRKVNKTVTIVGRIDDLDFAEVALNAGCDRVVSPSEVGGNMLFSALSEPSVVRWFQEASLANCGIELTDFQASKIVAGGKRLEEIELPSNQWIIGLDKETNLQVLALPDKSERIGENDTLVVLFRKELTANGCESTRKAKPVESGDVLIVGWNPTVRSCVNELLAAQRYTVTVLSNDIPISEQEHYSEAGITFINRDISKLSLTKALAKHDESVNIIVGIEEDASAILTSHIIRGIKKKSNLIVRIDETSNHDAAHNALANQIVSPSAIGGRLLAHGVGKPSSVSWIMDATTASFGADVAQMSVSETGLAEKTVKSFSCPGRYVVVAIERADGTLETMPSPDDPVHDGDTLIYIQVKES